MRLESKPRCLPRRLVLATNADGTAVTPECGACTPGLSDASSYDASLGGMRCAQTAY